MEKSICVCVCVERKNILTFYYSWRIWVGRLQLKMLLDVDGFDDSICVFAYIFFFFWNPKQSLWYCRFIGICWVPGMCKGTGSPVVSQAGILSLLKYHIVLSTDSAGPSHSAWPSCVSPSHLPSPQYRWPKTLLIWLAIFIPSTNLIPCDPVRLIYGQV